MKFLFDCDNEELLPATFDLAEAIEKFWNDTHLAELRTAPNDDETREEKAKKNLKKMFFRVCKEYPKETGALCDKLWICNNGEKAPNALTTFSKIIMRKDALDFFTSLLMLVR